MDSLRIIFLGTPEFALPFLQALVKSNYKPVLVVTQPDEPAGRKYELQAPPVKLLALKSGLKVAQPENKKQLAEVLKKEQPDICILVAYGVMVNAEILAIPRLGFINVHPSLLPKYRGTSPIQTAIFNGETKTGVSIMQLDSTMDGGPIFAQEDLSILAGDTNQSLHERLARVGADLLLKILPQIISQKLKAQKQDDSQATFTKIIARSAGQVDWQKSATEIDRKFRAFYPWPGLFTHLDGNRLKIVNLSVLGGNFGPELGTGELFLADPATLAVKCRQGAVALNQVQLEGRKVVSGADFSRGHQSIIGKILI